MLQPPDKRGKDFFPLPDRAPMLARLREAPVTSEAEAVRYSREAAEVLADIAAWSYSERHTLSKALIQRGIVDGNDACFKVSRRNDAMLVMSTAFFIQSQTVGVLCFRGTEPMSASSWLTDASIDPRVFLSLGRAHGGFVRNVRALWNDIDARVQGALEGDGANPIEAMYITGHSLGGAMAVIAAAMIFADDRYKQWRRLVRGIYTYGQPMAGDNEFAASCDELFGRLHFRHIYERDLVPRMPPVTTGAFKHSGSEYIGSRDGWSRRWKPAEQAANITLPLFSGIAAWVFKQFPLTHSIDKVEAHSPNSYLEAFRASRSERAV